MFSSVALKVCCCLKSSSYQTKKNHLYGINIQSLAFLRKKLKLKQYLILKTCNLLSVQRVERFSQQTAECYLSISRLAGLGTQQTVEYLLSLYLIDGTASQI